MIADKLHLDGDSLVTVFFRRGSIDESEAYFKALTDKVVDGIWPDLVGHLERMQVSKKADDCKTIEEVEKLRFPITPDDMFTRIAGAVDGIEELLDIERLFTVVRVGDVLIKAAYEHVRTVLQQRAQTIGLKPKPKSRIIH